MAPGTIFTMAGEQYRYLENQGGGNHMIIWNSRRDSSFNNQENRNNQWFDSLDSTVKAMVQPVAYSFVTEETGFETVILDSGRFMPTNLHDFPEVATDETRVVLGGTPRAFSLSLADVARLSGPGRAFPSSLERLTREGMDNNGWWLRTPATDIHGWHISANNGGLFDGGARESLWGARGIRPAIIINQ
ncbi:hypothetical protein AALA52_01315, partial [Lactococcus ileimucosae]